MTATGRMPELDEVAEIAVRRVPGLWAFRATALCVRGVWRMTDRARSFDAAPCEVAPATIVYGYAVGTIDPADRSSLDFEGAAFWRVTLAPGGRYRNAAGERPAEFEPPQEVEDAFTDLAAAAVRTRARTRRRTRGVRFEPVFAIPAAPPVRH